MEIFIVCTFEGAKAHTGAMWIHHLMILQAVTREAEVSSDMLLPDTMTLLDGDWATSSIGTVPTPIHGTSLWWGGKGMTLCG